MFQKRVRVCPYNKFNQIYVAISYRVYEENLLRYSKGLERLKFHSCHKNLFVRRLRA